MLNKSSWLTINIIRAMKVNLVPITLKKISTTSNGAKFYNSNCVSLMEHVLCSITFETDENLPLDIRDLKNKVNKVNILPHITLDGWRR